jgi:hypothetical protein
MGVDYICPICKEKRRWHHIPHAPEPGVITKCHTVGWTIL